MLKVIIRKNIVIVIILVLILSACNKDEALIQDTSLSTTPVSIVAETASPSVETSSNTVIAPTAIPEIQLESVDNGRPWYMRVDTYNQLVSVYALDENEEYTRLINQFMCSAGRRDNYTKKVFQILNDEDRYRWKFFETFGGGYCEYVTRIYKPFLFHSMMFETKNEDTLMVETYEALTFPDSHGCMRLMPQDAKWVYDNCIEGTYVEIVDDIQSPDLVQLYMPPPLIDDKYLPTHKPFGNERKVKAVVPNWDNFPSDGGWKYDPEVYG